MTDELKIAPSILAKSQAPLISIGVPVYNGEATLRRTLDSLLAQSFTDFELIISDNASTDKTAEICQEYAACESRIRYLRQQANIGAAANFRFVFEQARGRFYMWAACDDVRTSDFLEENIHFLESHPDYVASTCPNCYEGQEDDVSKRVAFSLEGSVEQRFRQFFDDCWISHGIFYSVIRLEILRECELIGQSFIAADWAIDLFLASRGPVHRTEKGLTILGLNGVSSKAGSYRAFRNQWIELFLPFYRLSVYALSLSRHFPLATRLNLLTTLIKLNVKAAWDQSYSALYQFYCARVKPLRRRANQG